MKKTVFLFAMAVITASSVFAQKLVTTSATIVFDATTSSDALPKAENKTVIASLDTKTGTVAFEANIKSFNFSNPTMQEHFNSAGWMNTDKYPVASFKGRIDKLSAVNFNKDGTYTATLTGDLTMHGETKQVITTAVFMVKNKKVRSTTDFSIALADYNVNGASIAAGKVAKEPKIYVSAGF